MAEDIQNVTLEILKDIQANLVSVQVKLNEHDRRFEAMDRRFETFEERMAAGFERMQQQMDYRFDRVDHELTDLLDNTIKASGEASVALVRHESVQRQFAEMELALRDMRARLQRLEEKV